MVFPVVMCGCESWTVKKAECRRIDAFELWCWRKLLRVPWTARRSSQYILKEIRPGISLEGMILKLKLHYFSHLMLKVDSLEKTLMLGGIGAGGEGDDRGWDGWMASPTRWTWVWVNSGSWWCTGRPGMLRFMGSQRAGRDWATELSWRIMYSARNGNQQLACSRAIDKSFEWSADLWRWHSMTTTLYWGHKGKHTWPCTWEMVFQGRSWSLKYLDMI